MASQGNVAGGYGLQSSTAAASADDALGTAGADEAPASGAARAHEEEKIASGTANCQAAASAGEAAVSTVDLSEEAYLLLSILRRDGESDARVVERALEGLDAYRIVEKALNSRELRKAFKCTRTLRRGGFGDETTTAICRALFGAQSEKDLRSAFRLLDLDESGFIDKDELGRALPFMSEDVPEERLEELFRLVDADDSGLIDFEEFATLVRGFNPKLQDAASRANPFSDFQADAQGGLDLVGEVLGSAARGATSTVSALSTAFSADLPGISAMEMRKAGAVLKKMRKAGYSDQMAETICRALFCEQSEKQLQRAFKFYDTDRSGFLDAVEFRDALPLMGESVPEERINELFRKAAVDESGNINFHGFCKLVKSMNPKKKKTKQLEESGPLAIFKDAANRVSRTWAAKTRDLEEEEAQLRKATQRRSPKAGGSASSDTGSVDRSDAMGSSPAKTTVHGSAGRVILPPKSQRVSIQRHVPDGGLSF